MAVGAGIGATAALSPAGSPPGQTKLPTTLEDFFQPGTQPDESGTAMAPVISSDSCVYCHADYLGPESYDEPADGWANSMMGQSARDPVWYAALAIANQDSDFSGEYCIRCHAPGAWLAGRSVPPDASAFMEGGGIDDFDGVNCHFCHRSVNPVLQPDSPPQDVPILAGLEFPPGDQRGNGRFVVDPNDVRRGPFDDVPQNMHAPAEIIYSPFHRRSEMCATCHDLGNPVYMRQEDDTHLLTPHDAPHPTQNPHDMFPEQTTYSEWLNSDFANGGVPLAGRFGGNHPTGIMEECQDCHMPDSFTGGCFAWEFDPFFPRPDMPPHLFAGANYWVLRAVREIYSDGETLLSEESVNDAEARTIDMLRRASDMQVHQVADALKVRIINYSGHRLPTGYPEGRRMWINVRFFDDAEMLIEEHGHYDFAAAELTEDDTKVYQMVQGLDEHVAGEVGLPAGPSSHLALNNTIILDNRIPPIGFTNESYETFGSPPVAYTYEDGQYWDDSEFIIPELAVRAVVTLYYQSMTKEYVQFLRDANTTDASGQLVYDLWADPAVGNQVPPVDMDMMLIDLAPPVVGDVDGDGVVGFMDVKTVISTWGPCPDPPGTCPADLDCNGTVGLSDLLLVLSNWGRGG